MSFVQYNKTVNENSYNWALGNKTSFQRQYDHGRDLLDFSGPRWSTLAEAQGSCPARWWCPLRSTDPMRTEQSNNSHQHQLHVPVQRQNVFFPYTALFFFHQASKIRTTHAYKTQCIYTPKSLFQYLEYMLILYITIFLNIQWIRTVGGNEMWLVSGAWPSSTLQLPSHPWSPSLFGFRALCHLGWCFPSKWHFSFGLPHCPAPSPRLAPGCHMVQMGCCTLAQSALRDLPSCCLRWQPAWWLHGLRREHHAAWK